MDLRLGLRLWDQDFKIESMTDTTIDMVGPGSSLVLVFVCLSLSMLFIVYDSTSMTMTYILKLF